MTLSPLMTSRSILMRKARLGSSGLCEPSPHGLAAARGANPAKWPFTGARRGWRIRAKSFLAEAHSEWSFDGVDPSADMLRLAQQTVGRHSARMRFHQGYIEDAPDGPFDAALCLLTFHFIPRDQRLPTLQQIRRRLVEGAPFVVAHISFPQTEPERSMWIARHVAYSGTDPANAESARHAISTRLVNPGS